MPLSIGCLDANSSGGKADGVAAGGACNSDSNTPICAGQEILVCTGGQWVSQALCPEGSSCQTALDLDSNTLVTECVALAPDGPDAGATSSSADVSEETGTTTPRVPDVPPGPGDIGSSPWEEDSGSGPWWEDSGASPDAAASDAVTPWGTKCAADNDCLSPTDMCVIPVPGEATGYCSTECPNLGAGCTHADWTCNVVGPCESPVATWCGPPSEVDESGGFITACE